MSAGSNRLPVLAEEIRAGHATIRESTEQIAARVIDLGHKLAEAKELVPHGEWLTWLREHCGVSPRSARRYMAIARSGLEIGHVATLGIRAVEEAIPLRPRREHVAWSDADLAAYGFSRADAEWWVALAAIPNATFEAAIAAFEALGAGFTNRSFMRMVDAIEGARS